jgi:DNA-binding GntR family transcriptional regulator
MDFHFFLYGLSENPLVAEVSTPHWSYLRRVMGEVLLHGETPAEIWDQHERILKAVMAGNPEAAEQRARQHIAHASNALARRMPDRQPSAQPPAARRRRATT